MSIDLATELGRQAMLITLLITMPAMITGLTIGLAISLFQSVTSIQEQMLNFVPKIIITLLVTVLTMPWILTLITEYTTSLYSGIPERL